MEEFRQFVISVGPLPFLLAVYGLFGITIIILNEFLKPKEKRWR